MSASCRELLGISGEAIELECNIFSGFTSLQILQETHNDLEKRNIEPEKFTDRIIFMSMFNDNNWTINGNEEICISNSEKVKMYAKKLSQGHWTFLGPGDEKKKKWYGNCNYHPEGKWSSSVTDGTTIQGNRSSSLDKCRCLESWNSDNVQRKRNHTLQCGCFKHRTLVPNHSFCTSAQYLQSSFEFLCAIRFDRRRKGTRKNSRKSRIRKQRKTEEWIHKKWTFWCLLQD